NWNLTTTNWMTLGGIPTNFAMGDIAIFNDSASVTNVNITEVVVPNQATNGVTITNSALVYRFDNNSGSGSIAGTAKILKQGTNVVIFSTAESGPLLV